jgi:hypothetical protein
LHRWGNPEHVCLAGLFHSIYGTRTFQTAVLGPEARGYVRGIIGERAESLVHIFARSDRQRLLLENRTAPFSWIDHRSGRETEIPEQVFNELVEIEVANFLEQLPFLTDTPASVFDDMRRRFEAVAGRMSDRARDACRREFDPRCGRRFPHVAGTPAAGQGVGSIRSRRSLDALLPIIVAANVRRGLDLSRYAAGPGRGQAGDLVVGCVMPAPGEHIVILDQARQSHTIDSAQRVLAVLGPRDSSTHVCAVIPPDGLEITADLDIHWVAGESGIVGCLERAPATDSIHAVESAVAFRCDGLLLDRQGRPVNIRDFAVVPETRKVTTPIVVIAATSSESGKTVLAGEVIRRLADRGMRVGAIKVSGTGGVLDSLHHQQCGAAAVLDHVDAGLITTHGEPDAFRRRIPLVFRQMQDLGMELIVAELGGDLLSANNPAFFGIRQLVDNTRLLLVLSNDALGAAGVEAINTTRFEFPTARVRHFSSPFRNHAGIARRMASAGIAACYDPCTPADLDRIADEIFDGFAPVGKTHEAG